MVINLSTVSQLLAAVTVLVQELEAISKATSTPQPPTQTNTEKPPSSP